MDSVCIVDVPATSFSCLATLSTVSSMVFRRASARISSERFTCSGGISYPCLCPYTCLCGAHLERTFHLFALCAFELSQERRVGHKFEPVELPAG